MPNSFGNALMLYYNKDIVADAPANTDELIELAVANTDVASDKYGLVYNQTQSFWLTPWLGGFGADVFDADGQPRARQRGDGQRPHLPAGPQVRPTA